MLVILLLVGFAYWYFIFGKTSAPVTALPGNQTTGGGFVPIDRPGATETPIVDNNNNIDNTSSTTETSVPIKTLRQLSVTPVGGFGIVTSDPTKTNPTGTTTIHWADRGRGNTYEAYGDDPAINILSNTLVPRISQSWWNKSLTSFFAQYSSPTTDTITTVLATIIKNKPTSQIATSTASSTQTVSGLTETVYQLKGALVSGNIIDIAVSPAKDKAIVVTKENNRAIGYISKFDNSPQKQLFSMPLTQITVDWPETNTVVVTTKGSSSYAGYLYVIDTKTGVMKQILGGVPGLSAKVSRDASRIFYSSTGRSENSINSYIYDLKTGITNESVFKTLADKCTWSQKFVENIYCAVPVQAASAAYPDDWYLGYVSFRDNIWLMNTKTGNANQIANLLTMGNSIIDAINLEVDFSDGYLAFMNKADLSLWILDLVSTN